MWTPRRIGLLVIGFACYLACYLAYGRSFLGAMDGLPALPEEYRRPTKNSEVVVNKIMPPIKRVEEKLKQAFGLECPELRWPIKLEQNSKKMVLASAQTKIAEDGRLYLKPISIALFGKDKGGFPEINTIRGNVAYIKFDRPVSSLADISGRKIVEAELLGPEITIVNNRHTEERTDDLSLYIGAGPLYYSEEKHKIWTHDVIHLKDFQSKPKPIEIWGTGMELDLLTEGPPAKPGVPRGKQKQESITGVKRIVLHSNVEMFLYTGANSAFPAGDHEGKKKAPPGQPVEEKAEIRIRTPGRFTYEFGKEKEHDVARFELPEHELGQELRVPQDVMVTRRQPNVNGVDQLLCQKLVLRLRRKQSEEKNAPKAPAPEGGSPDQNMEIETAHATGTEVTLTSDAENLEAHCVELLHDVRHGMTTLRGNPKMRAFKDGNVIHALEVQIQEKLLPPDKDNPLGKKVQEINARGPGQIDLLDKAKNKKTQHALWNDRLTSGRDGAYDLLTLTGDARFVDDEHDQFLQAEMLKVWLEDRPANQPRTPPTEQPSVPGDSPPQQAQPQQGRRPHHLEALKNVLARSPELNLHDTSRLVVWFKDVPAETLLVAPPNSSGSARSGTGATDQAGPAGPGAAPGTPHSTDAQGRPENRDDPEKKEPQRPIDLSARSVEAWVLRSDVKSTLDKLWTEGTVHVQQDPAKPDEKGVDIKGDTLQMTYNPEGNLLVVTGDLAQLRMDKIYILGPEVNIDQAANKAWVTGIGAMQMDSNTTFGGNKMDKTVPLTVHWNQSMLFNGKFAEFHGGIQAEQENARLTCQSLQVFFDRPISLKQGNNTAENPVRVQTLVCDKSVCIEETVMEGNRLVKWTRLMGTAVETYALENEEDVPLGKPNGPARSEGNQVKAAGPGSLRIYQPGGSDPLTAPPNGQPGQPGQPQQQGQQGQPRQPGQQGQPRQQGQPGQPGQPAKKPEEEEMKLTYVIFRENMSANNRSNKANFWGNVRVLNMPSDNPQKEIDMDTMLEHMPKEAFYLNCEHLLVLTRKENGRTSQEMEAKRRVMVQTRDYWGRCDMLTFNETKDQIIFHGTATEPARLWRVLLNGGQPEEIKGKKIIYLRTSGNFQVDDGNWINGR